MIINHLRSLGLSENEAKVYSAMLELGLATVLDISAKAGVNRPTTYVQIESLKMMGLVSTQMKGKKQLFIAESPEQLESLIERQKSELDQKKDELQKILPELTNIFNLSDSKPHVRFYEGREGLLKMHSELLKTKTDEVVSFLAMDAFSKTFPDYPKTLSLKRVQKGIKSRMIYTNRGEPKIVKHDEKLLKETRYISPDKFPFKSDIAVFSDKISISALEGKVVGVLIVHQELADSFKAIFNLLWNSLKD